MSNKKVFSTNEIRNSFLNFFESKKHLKILSSSLLPSNDPTLLFTTAGMVPFKNFFSGVEIPPSSRLTSIQKCLRTTDLENVGITKRHMSFFEMLGNFSFGDYFKKEAIEYAWEYTSTCLPFDKENIWVTVYQDDDEAYNLWHKHIGISSKRIVRLDKKDNFWGPVGKFGSCGPCSELYLDRGPEFASSSHDTQPGSDGERFLEFWNLVFIQYFQETDGTLKQLPKKGIDTGAGLERLASLVQGVDSVYDIDELVQLKTRLSEHFKISYEKHQQTMRIILDHLRALTFAISDGIYPSNDFRGYILRRILRRAVLFAHQEFQYQSPTLYKFIKDIETIYKVHYPELTQEKNQVIQFIKHEEERFLQTLKNGSEKLTSILEETKTNKKNILSGKHAFILYDTYGFPLELTEEIAKKNQLTVDSVGFEQEMEKQKQKGRASWNIHQRYTFPTCEEKTDFIGYERLTMSSDLVAIYQEEKLLSKADNLQTTYLFVTKKTPFYPEGGGQKADIGFIKTENSIAKVLDTKKNGDTIFHYASLQKGTFESIEKVILEVDIEHRKTTTNHHSATHLLHRNLQQVLGSHIRQSGSLVDSEHLRFDFTHHQKVPLKQIEQIETNINQTIQNSENTKSEVLPIEEAKKSGAMMIFGEKYGINVRVVSIGSDSKEFCGGTHVSNTSEIQSFIVTKEASPGAGNRRIEAKCGTLLVLKEINKQKDELQSVLQNLITSSDPQISKSAKDYIKIIKNNKDLDLYLQFQQERRIKEDLEQILHQQRKLNKKITSSSNQKIIFTKNFKELQQKIRTTNGISYLLSEVKEIQIQGLQILSDTFKSNLNVQLLLFFSILDNKWFIFCSANQNLIKEKEIHLGNILKQSLSTTKLKGGGGGKPNTAQASGSYKIVSDVQRHLNTLLKTILHKVLD